MAAPLDVSALRVPGAVPAVPPGGASGDANVAVLARFVAAVRRRRIGYDVAVACLSAAVLVNVVAIIALLVAHVDVASRWLTDAVVVFVVLAAAAVGVVVSLAARAPYWREEALVDLVEAEHPACANLLVTAHQLTRELARVKPYIRARVLSDAARVVEAIDLDDVLPRRVVWNVAGLAAFATLAAIAAVALLFYVATRSASDAQTSSSAATAAAASASTAAREARRSGSIGPAAIQHVSCELLPPAYTGLPASALRDPERLDALAGSRVRVRVEATADEVDLELDGVGRQTAARGEAGTQGTPGMPGMPETPGTFVRELTPSQSGVLVVSARTTTTTARRLIAVTLTADQPPTVTLTSPGHDLLSSDAEGRVRFIANATDDYGLRSLTLHYTKVSGSGERFEFKEAELPIAVTRATARQWQGVAERSLRDLGLGIGDTLVYYAAATDNRPGQERAVSDSYVIEIGQANAAVAGGFAVPKDEDVFAISLNALIQKTERLHARRTTLAPPAFGEAAMALAIEQRMVRSEFLFSMGTHGRVEDEEEEAENSNEIQEGRLKNRGQTELVQAVDLMTRAERDLTIADTGEALKAQRAALAAVQRAQSRQRYFLRTVPTPSRIDPTRRLTGNLSEAASSQHPAPTTSPDTRATAVRTLLDDCARLTAAIGAPSAAASKDANTTDLASSVAARLMALDPTSVPLHTAAASLLQVASLAARGRADEARAIVRSAVAAIMPLARDASAPPASPSLGADTIDPSLRGATVDALRHPGGQK